MDARSPSRRPVRLPSRGPARTGDRYAVESRWPLLVGGNGARPLRAAVLGLTILTAVGVPPRPLEAQQETPRDGYDPSLLQALQYRPVGPHRGGRVTAVTGVHSDPFTYYMGSVGGGVWHTDDAGMTWRNISDGFFEAGPVGSIAVAPSDPNVLYVGTGSACVRGNVSTGIGVYRSTDSGRTWTHVGLRDAGQIGRIRVHPRDPDVVYAAVLGHPFGRNEDRGVFRTRDGGATWQRVLYVSDSTGAVDLAMNPSNPRILYAAMWRVERKPWTLISGSRDSGIYRTTDAGGTWQKLAGGLPEGIVGKIGVTVSPADPDRVWAVVEAAEGGGGVYRSDDGGDHWTRVNEDNTYIERPWYYNHIYADPQDENTVYVVGEDFWKSVDGGHTFETIDVPHGDNHDLWINPSSPQIMIEANDGGANVSFNGGRTWSPQTNQPTAEFYSVTVDSDFPYRIYGPQQDNSTISVPSRTEGSGISIQRWISVGGCETGPVAVRPDDPNIVYAGCYGGRIHRHDRRTGQFRQIMDYPDIQLGRRVADLKYRFQWNAPIVISPHDPNVLYHASQYVHRSTNEGQSWELISPDLTHDDESKQGYAGEPITHDVTGVEVYGTVFALAESPHEAGVIWAGSNDGLVHVTRDGGATWTDVTPPDLPEWTTVNRIEVSPHEAGKTYVAAYRYRMDDYQPYVYRTEDYGVTWTRIADGSNGIPRGHPTRVVREDPDREGLLYAGTEFGLFVSFDDGGHWQTLQRNLPRTPVTDLQVHRKDLVVATQGRSFWVLDDLSPLHQLDATVASAGNHLFTPRTSVRTAGSRVTEGLVRDPQRGARLSVDQTGLNPEPGTTFYFTLGEEPTQAVTLEILDEGGTVIRTFSSEDTGDGASTGFAPVAGLNRFTWDLAHEGPKLVDGSESGPTAVPGRYQVRLSLGDWSETRMFDVQKDPRISVTQADFVAQLELLLRIRDRMTETHEALGTIRSILEQVGNVRDRLAERDLEVGELADLAAQITTKLDDVDAELIQSASGLPVAAEPKLSSRLGYLAEQVASADARPTDQSYDVIDDLEALLREQVTRLQTILDLDLASFNEALREEGLGAVVVPNRPVA